MYPSALKEVDCEAVKIISEISSSAATKSLDQHLEYGRVERVGKL
jgi:hypothetical protein